MVRHRLASQLGLLLRLTCISPSVSRSRRQGGSQRRAESLLLTISTSARTELNLRSHSLAVQAMMKTQMSSVSTATIAVNIQRASARCRPVCAPKSSPARRLACHRRHRGHTQHDRSSLRNHTRPVPRSCGMATAYLVHPPGFVLIGLKIVTLGTKLIT